jgi:hypothetical protein
LNRTSICVVMLFPALPLTLFVILSGTNGPQIVRGAENSQAAESNATTVESNMHEFMEYVFQPTYQRLKPAMASVPVSNQGWKSIKSDALILAEGGNLLLIRKPKDAAGEWKGFSLEVRNAGGQLYRAAKRKDFPAARNAYEQMLSKCNACHKRFAGGKHQLAL